MLDVTIRRPGIYSALIASAALAFFLATAVLVLPIRTKVQDVEISAGAQTTHQAAYSLQLALSTLLEREWGSLVGFSDFIDLTSYDGTRSFTDAIVAASEGVSWAGIAGLDGRIIVGSDGIREGENASQAAWFYQGLRGNRIGRPTGPDGGETEALETAVVYMSRPIRDPEGVVAGVAVYAVDMGWFTHYLAETADRLDVDVALLDENGKALFAYGTRVVAPISDTIKTQAELGSAYAGFAKMSGSQGYVSGVIPDMISGEMPRLRLALVVRMPMHGGASSLSAAVAELMWIVVGLFAIIGFVAIGFALFFLRPISVLAETAASIADGETVYPKEDRSSREAMLLSSALVRLRPSNE